MFPILDRPYNDTPYLEVVVNIDADGLVVLVGRTEFYISFFFVGKVKVLDCKITIDIAYNYIAVLWFHTSVDNGYISVTNPYIFHAVTFYLAVECGFGVPDKVTVKVKAFMQIVLRWRRKTSSDLWSYQQFK